MEGFGKSRFPISSRGKRRACAVDPAFEIASGSESVRGASCRSVSFVSPLGIG